MPWTMKVVVSSIRIATSASSRRRLVGLLDRVLERRGSAVLGGAPLDILDRAPRRFVHRHRSVSVLHNLFLEAHEALDFPCARDAENRDLLSGVLCEFQAWI